MSSSLAPSSCIRVTPFARGQRRLFSKQIYSPESKSGVLRRRLLSRGIALTVFCSLPGKDPVRGMEKLAFKPDGYNFWTWRGRKIHYVEQGQGCPIVLIHGFGASAFHWRYNIPELAKKYKVYALDLLGFGWSEKAIIEYDVTIWRDQVADFMKEIVKEPAILVGNSDASGPTSPLSSAAWLSIRSDRRSASSVCSARLPTALGLPRQK
ncbi:hypothetical protein KSP40_PGU002897 [Platanthera guangdongensis]|uniref:AB hydrolase-1 domain-containing protein n=1 Tax=Platanthera guangdongensis TaxID=2320717 RepID=A0ABR2LHW8_9ASPA